MDASEFDYREIKYRLESYGVFRILRKESAAFMLGFFQEVFKRGHAGERPQSELASSLAAFQEFARMEEGEAFVPRDTRAYLDEWANEGFLRKFYPPDSEEARYELTPDSERALEWIAELAPRSFVGAESRLFFLFEALRDLAYGAAADPGERRAALERKRAEIDAELVRLERGQARGMDDTGILERFYGAEDAARRLIADFKQIEQNFRDLDRETKEKVIASDRSRGSVLKDVFEHRDAIVASDQGRSFSSFWAFIMSLEKREELASLIARVLDIPAVKSARKSFPLDSLDSHLVSAGSRVQAMTHRLNEELRRFLDEGARRESLRVGGLVEEWKRTALALKEDPPKERNFMEIDGDAEYSLVMDRPLFSPEEATVIAERPAETGMPSTDAQALYDVESVDLGALAERIEALLASSSQTSLSELVSRFPVTQGAAEILGYLSLAAEAPSRAVFDDARARIEARNERHDASFSVDSPDPAFLSRSCP